MEKLIGKLKSALKTLISLMLYLLCFGVIIQLLIEEKIMGWDPVGNIQRAGPAFTGVIALVLLYLLFQKKGE